MTLFRHHLTGILLFPLGVMFMVVPLSSASVRLNYPPLYVALRTVGPAISVAGVAALLGLTLYHTAVARRRAEWAVLAPVLALALVLTLYSSNIVGNLLWGPRHVLRSPGTLGIAVFQGGVFVAMCAACAALAAWWMKGFPKRLGVPAIKGDLAAVGILILFSLWPRTVTGWIADRLGWGIGITLSEVFAQAYLRMALASALDLAAVLAPCAVVYVLLWRGRPAGVRWRGIALVSMWVVTSSWIGQMYRWIPHLDFNNLVQILVTGIVAGGLAMAYVHGMVRPLWQRARRQGAQGGEAPTSAPGPSAHPND